MKQEIRTLSILFEEAREVERNLPKEFRGEVSNMLMDAPNGDPSKKIIRGVMCQDNSVEIALVDGWKS